MLSSIQASATMITSLLIYSWFIGLSLIRQVFLMITPGKRLTMVEFYMLCSLYVAMNYNGMAPTFQIMTYYFIGILFGIWIGQYIFQQRALFRIKGESYIVSKLSDTNLLYLLLRFQSSSSSSKQEAKIAWLYKEDVRGDIIHLFECPDPPPPTLSVFGKNVIKELYSTGPDRSCPVCYVPMNTQTLVVQDCCHFICTQCEPFCKKCPLCGT
jgi:hypothetical protein